jgi:hypothetical protein
VQRKASIKKVKGGVEIHQEINQNPNTDIELEEDNESGRSRKDDIGRKAEIADNIYDNSGKDIRSAL